MSSSPVIEMEILGLSSTPGGSGTYALILTEGGEAPRRLPIIIGAFEAQAIALELENIRTPRPMTHDLIKNVLLEFDSEVEQIVIHELSEGTFYSRILFTRNGESVELDARPSDAIAVAIRFNARIYVAEAILEEAGIMADDAVEQSTQTEEGEIDAPADEKGKPTRRRSVKTVREAVPALSPLEALERDLHMAIETENYEKAAKIRDQIQKLKG